MRIYRDDTGRLVIDGEQNTVVYVTDMNMKEPDDILKNELPDEPDPVATGFTVVWGKKVDFTTPPNDIPDGPSISTD